MRRILSFLLAVMLLVCLAVSVSAESTTNLKLKMVDGGNPVAGVSFEIYKVGQLNQAGDAVLTGKFAEYPVALNMDGEDTSAQANALFAYAKKENLTPDATAKTDAQGVAEVETLSAGLYLVAGLPVKVNGVRYTTEPSLISLPAKNQDGEVVADFVMQVKFSKEETPAQTVSRKVLKIWDDTSKETRPASVKVYLLKNGTVYDTVELTSKSQWRYTWENLDADALWQIVEDVPKGYTVSVELEGSTFLLTNTATENPPETETTAPSESTPETTEPSESETTAPTETPTEDETTTPTEGETTTPTEGETTAPTETEATTPTTTKPTEPDKDKIPQTGMLMWPVILMGGLGLLLIIVGLALQREPKYDA